MEGSEKRYLMGQRRRSRELALQILYSMEFSHAPPEDAIALFYELADFPGSAELQAHPSARPFAEHLVRGVFLHREHLDRLIASASAHWRLERMPTVDRNILRMALYEMLYCADIPLKVAINEAIDIGKRYGSSDSGAFINGILDRLLPSLEQQRNEAASAENPDP